MRGTPYDRHERFAIPGIIPAYAGNTAVLTTEDFFFWDHPRICGEHTCDYVNANTTQGSSPHMRGTLNALSAATLKHGIIPAYAGNTIARPSPDSSAGDHPRICGEHANRWRCTALQEGSSPHMRGTLILLAAICSCAGIIPAYAGNTGQRSANAFGNRDHPRICGEHCGGECARHGWQGSSPHMRGTHCCWSTSVRNSGIIPAYAGNTRWVSIQPFTSWDHPRICGEHARR